MMTRQIIQLRATLAAALVAVVLAVSFLPAFAPPARAGSQPWWGGTIPPQPTSGGPDEPDDKNPKASATIRGPRVTAQPSGRLLAPGRAELMVSKSGFARWYMVFRTVVKAYWIR